MCGIAGLVSPRPSPLAASLAASWLSCLRHRGPDDYGWLCLGNSVVQRGRERLDNDLPIEVLLLQRRLAILDLTEAGWQPMATPDEHHFIVFNGEIYNHVELRTELEQRGCVFRSRSDTEVLLHALARWGVAGLPRLVGMFAFALLDVRRRRLLLARDPFGIKPLYYTSTRHGFAFASEIKALLEIPEVRRRVQAQRLYDYLRSGQLDHGGDTLFADIRQLPAAHYLELPLHGPFDVEPVCYWRVDLSQRLDISFGAAALRLRELFLESVRLHLRSDVPVGACLSGGIDSSAIVALMRFIEPRLELHTFSYVADDPACSEERWIDLAGGAARAVMHKVRPTPAELVADLDRLIEIQEEPFSSTSIYAQQRVFQLARENGIKVMLDGQGADEMLAGYRGFLASRLGSLLAQKRPVEAARFWAGVARLPGTGAATVLGRAVCHLLPPRVIESLLPWVGKEPMPAWLNQRWFNERGVLPLSLSHFAGPDKLRAHLHHTLVQSSLPMLLRFEDRNSMSHSLESRVPFLTPKLVQFLLSLPEEYLLGPDGTSKRVFRAALRGLVPDAILDRRDKIGFATPEQRWLNQLAPWVERTLQSPVARAIPAIHLDACVREWEAIRARRRRFDFRVWRWLNLIRWVDRFGVEMD